MSVASSIALILTMTALAAVPSASVALVIEQSTSKGVRAGIAAGRGIVFCDLVFLALALGGVSAMAEAIHRKLAVRKRQDGLKNLGGIALISVGGFGAWREFILLPDSPSGTRSRSCPFRKRVAETVRFSSLPCGARGLAALQCGGFQGPIWFNRRARFCERGVIPAPFTSSRRGWRHYREDGSR